MQEAFREFIQSIGTHGKLRLAPTPSGYPHAGNVFNFLLNYVAARSRGAALLLPIELAPPRM